MKHNEKSNFIKHISCQHCSSSDAYAVYDDGSGYCFSCQKYDANHEQIEVASVNENLLELSIKNIEARGINLNTCQKYGYGMAYYNNAPAQVANYFHKRTLVAQHIRLPDKSFKWIGDSKQLELFGQHLFESGKKRITITEGEIDCLTIAQCFDCKWPVVSVPSGIQSAHKYLQQNLSYVESFDEIILAFDDDEPGKQGVEKCMQLFTPGKVKVMSYAGCKDANELFLTKGKETLLNCWWNAQTYRPDGLVDAYDLIHLAVKNVERGYSLPFPELDSMLKGLRKKEVTLLTAAPGIGKSTFSREIAYHLLKRHNVKLGIMSLEVPPEDTLRSLAGIHLNLPIDEPGYWIEEQEVEHALKSFIKPNQVICDVHFGSTEIDRLISKLKFMAISFGAEFIILDHISMVVSGLKDDFESERKAIDRIMTELAALVNQTGVGILAVVHLRKSTAGQKSFNNGQEISLDDLRGSGGLGQMAWNVIALERNQRSDKPNDSKVYILKNRKGKRVGAADTLEYNLFTSRLLPVVNNNLTVSDSDEGNSEFNNE